MGVLKEHNPSCVLDERGNAIILTLVVATVLGITAPYLLQSMSRANAVADDANTSLLFRTLLTQAHSMMEDGRSCTDIFGGITGNPLSQKPAAALQTFNTGVNAISNISIYQGGPVANVVWTNGAAFGNLRITALQLQNQGAVPFRPATGTNPDPGNQVYKVQLTVTVDKRLTAAQTTLAQANGMQVGSTNLTASFPLMVKVNAASKIVGCSALTFNDGATPAGLVLSPVCALGYLPFGYAAGTQVQDAPIPTLATSTGIKCIKAHCDPGKTQVASPNDWIKNILLTTYGDINCI